MNNLVKRGLLHLLVAIIAIGANAQTVNTKFGKPTKEELQMTEYAADKDAEALVLLNNVEAEVDVAGGEYVMKYYITKRIKVLKDGGKDYGNVSVSVYDKEGNPDGRETLIDVKAFSYNLENGKVVKSKMAGNAKFDERINKNHKLVKFSVPQVKVGSVIEYKYTLVSPSISVVRDWYAQTSIPTIYAHYAMRAPHEFTYNMAPLGSFPLEVKREQFTNSVSTGAFTSGALLTGMECSFTGKNLPALKKDKFVWNVSDYCARVVCELSNVNIPGYVYKDMAAKWTDIDERLIDDEDFGFRLNDSNPFAKETALIDKSLSKTEKIVKAMTLLRSKLKWNGDYRLWARKRNQVMKDGAGSNADLNFILMYMLRDLGVKTAPVIMSTRDNGRLPLLFPSITNFNTFVVGAYGDDGKMVFVDAADEYGYINVLPPNLLVESGRVIEKGKGRWVDLRNLCSSRCNILVNGSLNADGNLYATFTANATNNVAEDMRRDMHNAKDSMAFLQKWIHAFDGVVRIKKDYKIEGATDFSPMMKLSLNLFKHCDATADHIYVNPMFYAPFTSNPFTSEKRALPTEFPFCNTIDITSVVKIPEGYVVESSPKGVEAVAPDGSMSLYETAYQNEGQIVVKYRFKINKMFVDSKQYDVVKDVFRLAYEKSKDMFVLKKQL